MNRLKQVTIYTDGACIGNPGPGGYGVCLIYGGREEELSGGFRETTNNRMEIMAAIVGLETLKERYQVTLYSDSEYLVKAIKEGWAKRWQEHSWRRNKRERVQNPDLWVRLLQTCDMHDIEFKWVKAHSDNAYNVRCDQLANEAALRPNLPIDDGYENPRHRLL